MESKPTKTSGHDKKNTRIFSIEIFHQLRLREKVHRPDIYVYFGNFLSIEEASEIVAP